jgi:hypothetical protein
VKSLIFDKTAQNIETTASNQLKRHTKRVRHVIVICVVKRKPVVSFLLKQKHKTIVGKAKHNINN